MNVETILKGKGRNVITVTPETSVEEAVGLLRRKGIGAVVVSHDGTNIDGILSERDILHALADHGTRLFELKVAALMSRNVVTCRPTDSVADLMGLMTERRFRHVPVVQNGALCGLVSIGDVVKSRIDEVEWEASSLREFITQT